MYIVQYSTWLHCFSVNNNNTCTLYNMLSPYTQVTCFNVAKSFPLMFRSTIQMTVKILTANLGIIKQTNVVFTVNVSIVLIKLDSA